MELCHSSQPHAQELSYLVCAAFQRPEDESHTRSLEWLIDMQVEALYQDLQPLGISDWASFVINTWTCEKAKLCVPAQGLIGCHGLGQEQNST